MGAPGKFTPYWLAARRRCPRCGSKHIFDGWFKMKHVCPECELDFERNPGAFIGGIGLNTMVSFGAIVVAIVLSFAVTGDDRSIVDVLAAPIAVAAIVPLVFFPYSKTLWLAFELISTPPADELPAQ